VVSGSNPTKSLTEGWIYLGGELLKVDAISATLDTATNDFYEKVPTFDVTGDKTAQNGTAIQAYQKNRGTITTNSGNLASEGLRLLEMSGGAIFEDTAGALTELILRKKIIEIGDWNMDTTVTITVAHGLADEQKIREMSCMIRNDAADTVFPLGGFFTSGGQMSGGVDGAGGTNVTLSRDTSGQFDSPSFDSTSFNRGWLTIVYTV